MGAGPYNVGSLRMRADRALAQNYGRPVIGKSGSISYTGSEGTATLKAGYQYLICPTTDCFFCVGGSGDLSTTAANQVYLPAFSQMTLTVGSAADATLHVVQVSSAGSLYISAWDDVP